MSDTSWMVEKTKSDLSVDKALDEASKIGMNVFEAIIYGAARARNLGDKNRSKYNQPLKMDKTISMAIKEMEAGQFYRCT